MDSERLIRILKKPLEKEFTFDVPGMGIRGLVIIDTAQFDPPLTDDDGEKLRESVNWALDGWLGRRLVNLKVEELLEHLRERKLHLVKKEE